jgi:hypothetical protein
VCLVGGGGVLRGGLRARLVRARLIHLTCGAVLLLVLIARRTVSSSAIVGQLRIVKSNLTIHLQGIGQASRIVHSHSTIRLVLRSSSTPQHLLHTNLTIKVEVSIGALGTRVS